MREVHLYHVLISVVLTRLTGGVARMFQTARIEIARAGTAFALLLGVLGQIIDFAPHGRERWFTFAACVAAAGLLAPHRKEWLVSLVLIIGLAWFA